MRRTKRRSKTWVSGRERRNIWKRSVGAKNGDEQQQLTLELPNN